MPRFVYKPIPEPANPAQAKSMSRDDARLLLAQRNERSSRDILVDSLCSMGRFEEALAITDNEEKIQWIESLKAAESAPDEARCECNHFIDEADYTRNAKAKPILRPSRNYLTQYRFWSSRYGCIVLYQVCFKCGHANAIPEAILPKEQKR